MTPQAIATIGMFGLIALAIIGVVAYACIDRVLAYRERVKLAEGGQKQ